MQSIYNNSKSSYLKKEAEWTVILQDYERLEKRNRTIQKEIELSERTLLENNEK